MCYRCLVLSVECYRSTPQLLPMTTDKFLIATD
nr:MAG TPA: hypothetical protein [Caudoviricetes sp.]